MNGQRFDQWTRNVGRWTLDRNSTLLSQPSRTGTLSGERFDRITRSISTVFPPVSGPSSRLKVMKVLAHAFWNTLTRRRFLVDVGFAWQAGKSAATLAAERMEYVRTRSVRDIKNVQVNPAEFLAQLHHSSRAEFLSVLTPDQRQQFMRVRTSAEFFNLLTPDQRATLAVEYQPRFAAAGNVSSSRPVYAGTSSGLPPSPPTASPASSQLRSLPTGLIFSGLNPGVIASTSYNPPFYVPPRQCSLSWDTCHHTFQATLSTDRDGSPCTYGPYPCGSSFPPAPPGKTYSPFCSGNNADMYGCGAMPYQVAGVTSCPGNASKRGVPLEHICNATDNVNCSYDDLSSASFKSVVTDHSYPNRPNEPKRCITDSYREPITGDLINVPVKRDKDGYAPCIQQSEPGACGGIDCPCPGLYISQTAFRSPNWSAAPMNPDNYLNGLNIPYISVPKLVYQRCQLKPGMFVVVSSIYDARNNRTENPEDWVAGVVADVGAGKLGEVSYAMRSGLGMPSSTTKVTFRIYPEAKVEWPVTMDKLNALKNKYLGQCCPGALDNQCHYKEERGVCLSDPENADAGTCQCKNGWLPDIHGDCTWYCPGSDGSKWVGLATDSGYEECDGHGRCKYQPINEAGETIGECRCDDGWWGFLKDNCNLRDCVKLEDWTNPDVPPCYGHGQCNHGVTVHTIGSCTCNEGWSNGANGLEFCSEPSCLRSCSGHGTCIVDSHGNPVCVCDIAHGWYGVDCSQRGCVTQNNLICSGHGTCQLDGNGNPYCACVDEWGGNNQTGPNACGERQCYRCPPGVASCTNDWNWGEIFCFCACGNNCKHRWTCHCNNSNYKPPDCSSRRCCSGFWGECNNGMHIQGIPGGGICQSNGVCQCYDNFDPNQCCAYRLPGAGNPPPGFGKPCYGTSSKTIVMKCAGTATMPCGSCIPGYTENDFTLRPDGLSRFRDQFNNQYRLEENVCKLVVTAWGPDSSGGICGTRVGDDMFWINISGNTGNGVSKRLCPADCTECLETVPCSVTLS